MWQGDESLNHIATELDVSMSVLYAWAKELRLPSRASRIGDIKRASHARKRGEAPPLAPDLRRGINIAELGYMEAEAARRGLSVAALERRLLATIAKDRMVLAVLDDALVA